jgi:hypothetical protein
MLGIGILVLFAVAPQLVGVPEPWAPRVRIAGTVLFGLACAALLFAQVPAIGSWAIGVDDAPTAEQSIATRLYLWDAAEDMVLARPLLGYGPSGYRVFAVEFYDAGVFPFIAAAGSDPIAYSAPSPHSVFWEVLTRLGIVGLAVCLGLLAAWFSILRRTGGEDEQTHALRLALVVGFVTYLFSLLVTPVHFASGLLGVVVAGLAVARATSPSPTTGIPAVLRWIAALLAIVLIGYGGWRMFGLSTGTIGPEATFEENQAAVVDASAIIPGEPLNERRVLEVGLFTATDPTTLAVAQVEITESEEYIQAYAPNLVQFASISLTRAEELGITDTAWERELLGRAALLTPDLPSLVAEELHLAIVEEDTDSLPALIQRAELLGTTYPPTSDYVARARELLGQ